MSARPTLPWPVRSIIAGAAGTAAMSLAYAAERRLRPRCRGSLDYDDSLVPGQIVAGVLHLPDVTEREEYDLGMALRWGYGSAFGLYHGVLRRLRVRAVGQRHLRRDADDRHALPVPADGPHAPALALAAERHRDQFRHPRRLRGGGGGRRRPSAAPPALGDEREAPI